MIKNWKFGVANVTSNTEELLQAQQSQLSNIIILDDDRSFYEIVNPATGERVLPPKVSFMSILLPSFNIVDIYMNGDKNGAFNMYEEYLYTNKNAIDCIESVVAVVLLGKNILFYIPGNANVILDFSRVLFEYIAMRYNLIVAPTNSIGGFTNNINDSQYLSALLNGLYVNNVINITQYMILYPNNILPCMEATINIITKFNISNEFIKNCLGLSPDTYLTQDVLQNFVMEYINGWQNANNDRISTDLIIPFVQVNRRQL